MAYAEKTEVPAERSRAEIERTLQRYGAEAFMYGWEVDRAIVRFRANGRHIQFVVPMPDRKDEDFTHYRRGNSTFLRTELQAEKAWEQAVRQRWRALSLCIKAKLEAVEAQISEFEDEFLAHIVLPDGTTAGAWLRPQIHDAYEHGTMPTVLPALGAGS